MSIVLLLLLGVVAVVSFMAYKRAKQAEMMQQLPPGYGGGQAHFAPVNQLPGPASNAGRKNLMDLRLNDIVSYFGQDFQIEGRIEYWDEGYRWISYMLVDGPQVKWLSVEEDDRLEVSLWDEVTEPSPS